jgi:hypothetical protein
MSLVASPVYVHKRKKGGREEGRVRVVKEEGSCSGRPTDHLWKRRGGGEEGVLF